MSDDFSNEANLVQRREDRRTLAKMRSKLATSGQAASRMEKPAQVTARRNIRIWPFVIALAVALAGMNFALHTQQDKILGAMGADGKPSKRLEAPPGLSLDEQVRFWCYAVYDFEKMKKHFKLPKGVVFDKVSARKNLDALLAEDLGTEVRNEIFAYQQANPDPKPVAKAVPKARSKKKK